MTSEIQWTPNNRIARFIAHGGNILDEYRNATLTFNFSSKAVIEKLVEKLNDPNNSHSSVQLPTGSRYAWFKKSADQWMGVFDALYAFFLRLPEKQSIDYIGQARNRLSKAIKIHDRARRSPHGVNKHLSEAWAHNLQATAQFLKALEIMAVDTRNENRNRAADLAEYIYET